MKRIIISWGNQERHITDMIEYKHKKCYHTILYRAVILMFLLKNNKFT